MTDDKVLFRVNEVMMIVFNITRNTRVLADLTIADSFGARFAGLMGRDDLPPGCGLWLDGTNSIHMMFMHFPIDCLFLSAADAAGARTVVAIRQGLRPWTGVVWWARGAKGVLEMPVGAIEASDTRIGDRIVFEQ
jgi:uncharacterized protein